MTDVPRATIRPSFRSIPDGLYASVSSTSGRGEKHGRMQTGRAGEKDNRVVVMEQNMKREKGTEDAIGTRKARGKASKQTEMTRQAGPDRTNTWQTEEE